MYHSHGLFAASTVALFARALTIMLPKFEPDPIVKLMARATVMMGVPTFYTRLLQSAALTKESTKNMRLLFGLRATAPRYPSRMGRAHRPRRA